MVLVKLTGGPFDGDSGHHQDDYGIHGVFLPETGVTHIYRFQWDRVVNGVTERTLRFDKTIRSTIPRRKHGE